MADPPWRTRPVPGRLRVGACALLLCTALLAVSAAHAQGLRLDIPPNDRVATETAITPGPAAALSLEDAVAMALQNAPGLRAERLAPLIQGTFEAQERAVFDPTLFAEVELARDRSVRQFQEIQVQEAFRSERERSEAGLRQTLPTGTELTLSLRSTRTESSRAREQYTGRAGISLTQALLRGGRIESNLVRLRQAALDVTASEFELRGFIERLVADVEAAYWDAVLAAEDIAIYEEALDVAERQLRETRARIRAGDRPETEEIGARAEAALRRQGLIDARTALARAQDRLARLVRAETADWEQRFDLTSPPAPQEYVLEPVADYIALGLLYRPDLNETRLRIQRGELEIVQTRNGLLPRLDFFLTLGASGFAESFSASLRGDQGDGYDLVGGLRFELPLGSRAADAAFSRARLTREQTRAALDSLERLAIQDIRANWLEADRARAQVHAREETVALQRELLRVEEVRFRVGTGTALAVAQAQRDLLESELSLREVTVRFRQASTELLQQSGALLLHRGIDSPGQDPVHVL
ncbi:TolC family protein [Thioalkalivibrio nitratireducens]|uniref:TolC family protein n=1 Tax=Thioalkalivibrio nitratireducens TaxID=186931 RepID=UPI003AAB4FE3